MSLQPKKVTSLNWVEEYFEFEKLQLVKLES